MTSQGSALTRLRRALDHEAIGNALSAAAELERVALSDALELVALLHRHDHARFARAALAWHGRFEREMQVSFAESQAVLACLAAMGGDAWRESAGALAELLGRRRELRQATESLVRYAIK
jgi:hypothetical protein